MYSEVTGDRAGIPRHCTEARGAGAQLGSSPSPPPCLASAPTVEHVQHNQPPGVPPLALTGERTLPDVPEENYWFRRHLVVYEWIAAQVRGRDVVDMACGEGYGVDVLARSGAASVVGVDANPEAHE